MKDEPAEAAPKPHSKRRPRRQLSNEVCCGSFASVWPRTDDFRSIPINRHRYRASACLKCAKLGSRHDATSKFKLVERSILLV